MPLFLMHIRRYSDSYHSDDRTYDERRDPRQFI